MSEGERKDGRLGQAFDDALIALRGRYLVKLGDGGKDLRSLIAFCEMDRLTWEVGEAARSLAHKLIRVG
jgi:hypothetical protein